MVEIEKGILIIGMSNTVLFGGEESCELILLDVATGNDFSLPVAPEQVEHLLSMVSVESILNTPAEDTAEACGSEACGSKSEAEGRERLDGILKGEKPNAAKHEDAWKETEAASQF